MTGHDRDTSFTISCLLWSLVTSNSDVFYPFAETLPNFNADLTQTTALETILRACVTHFRCICSIKARFRWPSRQHQHKHLHQCSRRLKFNHTRVNVVIKHKQALFNHVIERSCHVPVRKALAVLYCGNFQISPWPSTPPLKKTRSWKKQILS